jgi:hypothetical protein
MISFKKLLLFIPGNDILLDECDMLAKQLVCELNIIVWSIAPPLIQLDI